MPIIHQRPFKIVRTRLYDGRVYETVGTHADEESDLVYVRNKTPKAFWRPPTTYARYVKTGQNSTFSLNGHCNTTANKYTRSGAANAGGFYWNEIPAVPQHLVDRTVAKCLQKLKNDHVNLGQAFAERKQTASLLDGNVRQIIRSIDQNDGGPLKELAEKLPYMRTQRRLRKGLEAIANKRLEIAYGWTPLLLDSKGAIEHLMEREKESNRAVITVKSGAKEEFVSDRTLTVSDAGCNVVFEKRCRVKHKVFTRLDYTQTNPGLHEWAQLGLTNPAELAWELIPFSFVADWFLPIGNYLNQLDAALGMQFLGGSTTRVSKMESYPINVRVPDMTNILSQSFTAHGKGYIMNMHRQALTEAPGPTWTGIKPGKSSSHAFNGAALITNAFSKNRRWWT